MLDLGELTLDISASPLLDLVIFRAFASGVVVEEFTKLVDITANQTLFSFFSFLVFFFKFVVAFFKADYRPLFYNFNDEFGLGKKANLF